MNHFCMNKTKQLSSLLAGLFLLAACAADPKPVSSSPPKNSKLGHQPGPKGFKTIIIDAGHGGKDSGAVSNHTGNKEKYLTLDTAKRIQSALKGNFKTILMRSDDTFIDLDERVLRANKNGGAILVSIHYNSGSANLRGPETYFWRVDSHGLATRCQQAMCSVSPLESGNRGLVRRRIRLTRNPEIPCILLEGGYLSNKEESSLIAKPEYRQKLAEAIVGAIRTQSSIGDQGTGKLPPPLNEPMSRPTDKKE
jgi:N-acetylmuramoyl-L-alanine amidase